MTTVPAWPGHLGLWHVGAPQSGPMDDRSFRPGNLAIGKPDGTPGLECTLIGPQLEFRREAVACITGGDAELSLTGTPVAI
jgi:urea carboxylase